MADTAAAAPARELTDELKQSVRDVVAALRANMPGFTGRNSQNVMIGAVTRTLASPGGVLVVEAPTGTGKSIAYLAGALPVAMAAKRRLVVATATIALQEQLHRELPSFLAAAGIDAQFALAKGRRNYACTRDLFNLAAGDAQQQIDLGDGIELEAHWPRAPKPEEAQTVAQLAEALRDGHWDGDLDTAPLAIADELRPLLTTTSGGCAGRHCAYSAQCAFLAARRQAEDAHIVIANQALVMADLAIETDDGIGGAVLPRPEESFYVLDEGHHLEAAAMDAGAAQVHLPSVHSKLPRLRRVLAAGFRLAGKAELAGKTLAEAHKDLDDLGNAVKSFEQAISAYWQPTPGDKEPTWRAAQGLLPGDWRERAQWLEHLCADLVRWCATLRRAVKDGEGTDKLKEKALRDLGQAREQLAAQGELWQRWALLDDPDGPPTARWISLGADQGLVLHASDISGASLLASTLFQLADGVVITSATLSAGGDFSALREGLGLPKHAELLSLPSPFDLPRQAELVVPWMDVLPSDATHAQEVARWLDEHLDWDAGSLVLFTSKKKQNEVAGLLPSRLRAKVRVQGERAKQVLLAEHAAAIARGEGSVLFGLSSFGEGLDLKGELCTTVVISQLPFAVPTEPIGATKAEYFESSGRNPFSEISVPDAIRTLTQYAGRLIRSTSDEGRIVILDGRIARKSYGMRILRALPPFAQRVARSRPRVAQRPPVSAVPPL